MNRLRTVGFVLMFSILMVFNLNVHASEYSAEDVLNQINSSTMWTQLQQIVESNATILGIDMNRYSMLSSSSKSDVMRSIGANRYTNVNDFIIAFARTVEIWLNVENHNTPSSGGGGGGSSTKVPCTLAVGDYVYFGNYLYEPILWRVVNINPDGSAMLYSEKVLSFKAFDANGDSTDGRDDSDGNRVQHAELARTKIHLVTN